MKTYSIKGYVSTPNYIATSHFEMKTHQGNLMGLYRSILADYPYPEHLIIVKYVISYAVLEPSVMYDFLAPGGPGDPTMDEVTNGAEELFKNQSPRLNVKQFHIEYIKFRGEKYTKDQLAMVQLIT